MTPLKDFFNLKSEVSKQIKETSVTSSPAEYTSFDVI